MRPKRTARARNTQARVVGAASALFLDKGYVATTMAEIAAASEVSVQTLYLSFGGKVDILSAIHDVALVGDDEPVPVLERAWVRQLAAAPDACSATTVLIEHETAMNSGIAAIHRVVRAAAADSDVGGLLERWRQQRRIHCRSLADLLVEKSGVRQGLPAQEIADIVYTATSIELFDVLVADLGWTDDRAGEWMLQILQERILQ